MSGWSICDMTLTRERRYTTRSVRNVWILKRGNEELIIANSRSEMELKMALMISDLRSLAEVKK